MQLKIYHPVRMHLKMIYWWYCWCSKRKGVEMVQWWHWKILRQVGTRWTFQTWSKCNNIVCSPSMDGYQVLNTYPLWIMNWSQAQKAHPGQACTTFGRCVNYLRKTSCIWCRMWIWSWINVVWTNQAELGLVGHTIYPKTVTVQVDCEWFTRA